MAIDQVPMDELVDNALGADGVVGRDIVDRLVREHDSPSESIVRFIALVDGDLVIWIAEFQAYPQVQAGGPTPKTDDFHYALSFVT